jgi:hypothetical protein
VYTSFWVGSKNRQMELAVINIILKGKLKRQQRGWCSYDNSLFFIMAYNARIAFSNNFLYSSQKKE